MRYHGQCHCGALRIELATDLDPAEQTPRSCQCSFCRKHNARAFSDPNATVTLTACEPAQLQRYAFGLKTAEQIICRRCGVYMAMTLTEDDQVWSVINIDTLDDRKRFTQPAVPFDYSDEDRAARIARRKSRWSPTILIGWPPHAKPT